MSYSHRATRTLVGLVAAALAATLAAGCGYTLVGRGSNIPEDVKNVYLAPLVNQTQRSQVEQFLTQAIADELVTRGSFTLVSGVAEAHAQLEGTVYAFAVTPVTFDNQGRATEYEIAITARVSFERVGVEDEEAAVLWRNERYVFRQSYEVDTSATNYFDQEDVAIEEASERFAETMVSDLLEGF